MGRGEEQTESKEGGRREKRKEERDEGKKQMDIGLYFVIAHVDILLICPPPS